MDYFVSATIKPEAVGSFLRWALEMAKKSKQNIPFEIIDNDDGTTTIKRI